VLDFTQEGILRKDDLFKVVFNPGADKREKRILGQTVQCAAWFPMFSRKEATNDTGWVRLRLYPKSTFDSKASCVDMTQLL